MKKEHIYNIKLSYLIKITVQNQILDFNELKLWPLFFYSYYELILNKASAPEGVPAVGAGKVTVNVPLEQEKSAPKSKITTWVI